MLTGKARTLIEIYPSDLTDAEWAILEPLIRQRFPARPRRVGDLIGQMVSFLASETILGRRREPMYSLLCWYCTRSQQKSPEINAKSGRCDSYHDQVPEEEVPFVRREPDYKPACTLRRFMCRVFAERSSITGKKVGKCELSKRMALPPIKCAWLLGNGDRTYHLKTSVTSLGRRQWRIPTSKIKQERRF